MEIFAFFTSNGVPETGLTAKMDVWDSAGNHHVNDQPMIEIAGGFYKYDFAAHNPNTDYVIRADGSSTLGDIDRYKFSSNEHKEELYEIPTLTDTELSGNHGAGSWEGTVPLLETTIVSGMTVMTFTLSSGSDIDNKYKGYTIVVYDASNNDYPSVGHIDYYIGSGKLVVLESPGLDFTPVFGDVVKIFAPTGTPSYIAGAVWDEDRDVHNTPGTFGFSNQEIREFTVTDMNPSDDEFETDLAELEDDYWKDGIILFRDGVNSGLSRTIRMYQPNEGSKITLLNSLPFAPGSGDRATIIPGRAFSISPTDVNEIKDGIWNANRDMYNMPGTFGYANQEIVEFEIMDANPSQTTFETTLFGTVDGYWNDSVILFRDGFNEGVIRKIQNYTVANRLIELETPLPNVPNNGNALTIIHLRSFSSGSPTAADVADAVWDENVNDHQNAGSFGKIVKQIKAGIDAVISFVS